MEAKLDTQRLDDATLMVSLSGHWTVDRQAPLTDAMALRFEDATVRDIHFNSSGLERWDSSLVVFLNTLKSRSTAAGINVNLDGLPAGTRRLLRMSETASRAPDARPSSARPFLLARLGQAGINSGQAIKQTLDFIGELALSGTRLMCGKARLRSADVARAIQECGWEALPIVSLISILVGLILAFMGAVQLRMFGAQIFVADLVGIGMAREMGAVMTGVIMAGRTGAAFAANIGSMQVNEEIDALRTLGISPIDHLVLPRTAALVLMMPLLCIYSDFMGILGGMVVGVGAFDISTTQYLAQTHQALTLTHLGIGVVKSVFFGLIVAFCGCMQGMHCGRSAADVGKATTSAVVIAIVYIVVADGLFAVLANALGI
jgi:phospholipid/cholesterol/gamma-HCH transport system permease protein